MGIDRIPECPQRELGCPKESWKCPQQMRDWITSYLESEETLTRGKSFVQAAEIISTNRLSIEAVFKERGCTLFAELLQHRAEIAYSHGVQAGIRRVDQLRAASRATGRTQIYR